MDVLIERKDDHGLMVQVGQRLRRRRFLMGLNQEELARKLGVSQQAVQKWETGGAPRGNRLGEIAKALDITLEYLLTGSITVVRSYPKEEEYEEENKKNTISKVPLISWKQAADWENISKNNVVLRSLDLITSPVIVEKMAFALRIEGASMEPKYRTNDIIYVDPSIELRHEQSVVVYLHNQNETTVRQLFLEGEKKILKVINPDWPGPKLYELKKDDYICGVIVGKWVPEPYI